MHVQLKIMTASTRNHHALPQVSPFQALLLVLTFRPDRLQAAMDSFVCATLNVKGVVPLPFSLKVSEEHLSSCRS